MPTALQSPSAAFGTVLATADSQASATPSQVDVSYLGPNPPATDDGFLHNGDGGLTWPWLVLCPFGKAASGTFTVYVYGYNPVRGRTDGQGVNAAKQWHPVLIAQFDVTLAAGTIVGVAGGLVDGSHVYADTIADPSVGTKNVDVRKVSPGGGQPAYCAVNVLGSEWVLVKFKKGTASDMNALYRFTGSVGF